MTESIPSTLNDAYYAIDPSIPLTQDDSRYIDFQNVRGENDEISAMVRRISRTRDTQYICQLFTGHRGCGKSTELFRLKRKLEAKNFFVVYFDVEQLLDIGDIDYTDILLAIAEQLEKQLRENANISINKKLLENISKWFSNIVEFEEDSLEGEIGVSAEAGIGVEIPFFAKLFSRVRSDVKTSSLRRTEVRKNLERRSSELIERVNELIDDAQVRLQREGKSGLVFIVDSLEKVRYRVIDEESKLNSHTLLFVENGEHLRAPNCHIVYTFPINLMLNANVGQIFQTTILPMIKINEEAGNVCDIGRQKMYRMLAERINIESIFSDTKLVDKLISASGGHLRDFLRLVRYAFDLADEEITRVHIEKAINKLALEYDYLVKPNDLPRLHTVAREHQTPSDSEHALLLYNLLVLEYRNGKRWADVHPMVKGLPKFKNSKPEILA